MAHFRAEIRGARGVASRLGHKSTGISTLLQTWGWDVRVSAWACQAGQDIGVVELVDHSTGERRHVANVNLSTGQLCHPEGD